MRPAARCWWAAAAWAGGGLALFAFFLRMSLGSLVDSLIYPTNLLRQLGHYRNQPDPNQLAQHE